MHKTEVNFIYGKYIVKTINSMFGFKLKILKLLYRKINSVAATM